MKQQKGITLIALVITIIVLLILAGVTIAMLTGSDSAPVKANEAKQKQDIGAAKDQVYIWAQEAQTTAYENIYVNAKSADGTTTLPNSKQGKATNIGTYVGKQVATKGTTVGLATITMTDQSTTNGTPTGVAKNGNGMTASTCQIVITTTDFSLTGYIDLNAGALVWQDSGIVTK